MTAPRHPLVIVDSQAVDDRLLNAMDALVIPSEARPILLCFVDDPGQRVAGHISKLHPGVQVLRTGKLLTEDYDAWRASITDFSADLRKKLGAVAHESGGDRWGARFAKLWWYTTLSEKNCLGDPPWWELGRYRISKSALEAHAAEECFFIGGETLHSLIKTYCERNNIPVRATILSKAGINSVRSRLRRRLLRGFRLARAASMAARYSSPATNSPLAARAVLTVYPRMWTNRFGIRQDMYYGRSLEALNHLWLMCLFDPTDGGIKSTEYRRRLNLLREESLAMDHVVMESHADPKAILKRTLSPSDLLRYRTMCKAPGFMQSFEWEGTNTAQVLIPLLDKSFYETIPFLESQEEMFARCMTEIRPERLLIYAFEYSWGRSWINGTRKGSARTHIVGMQHGPGTTMMFMDRGEAWEGDCPLPMPDRCSMDGTISARHLEAWSGERTIVRTNGPARFDAVWEKAASLKRKQRRANAPLRVLLAPGLHDANFCLDFVLKGLKDCENLELTIRPHPKVGDSLFRGLPVRVERDGTIYENMGDCDLFLTTYSSTGLEALAFGLPVVIIASSRTPEISLLTSAGVPVIRAETTDELRQALELLNDNKAREAYRQSLLPALETAFGPCDSKAGKRLIDFFHKE